MRSTLLYVLIAALLLCTVNAYGLTHKKNAKTVREIPIDEHIISVCPPTPFPPRILPISLSPSLLSSSFPRWSTRWLLPSPTTCRWISSTLSPSPPPSTPSTVIPTPLLLRRMTRLSRSFCILSFPFLTFSWERPHFNLLDLTYAALLEAN